MKPLLEKLLSLNAAWIAAGVTALVLAFPFVLPHLHQRLELLVQDAFFLARGPLAPGPETVIAAIDEKSIDRLGRWPWPRSDIASLLDSLKDYRVKAVGLDIVFSSPDNTGGREVLDRLKSRLAGEGLWQPAIEQAVTDVARASDQDRVLRQAVKESRRTVLGYFFHFSRAGLEHLSDREMERYLENIEGSRYAGIKKAAGVDLRRLPLKTAYAVESNIREIADATRYAGYFNFIPEVDGSVRKVPLLVKYRDMVELPDEQDYLFPPLSMMVLRKYLKSAIVISLDTAGVAEAMFLGRETIRIPTNSAGEMWINYYGPGGSFPHYPVVDIIDGTIPAEKLKGKIVLVGPTATAVEDLRVTPFDKAFPGVESHATIVDNILSSRFIAEPSFPNPVIALLTVLALGGLLTLAVNRLGAFSGGLFALALGLATVGVYYYLFSRDNLVLHYVPPFMEIGLVYLTLTSFRFLSEEREKRFIRETFSHYLSPAVIEELMDDPSKMSLGGERKELTAFFSDIAGFTSISEKLDAEEIVLLLNDYLTDMSNILMDHGGTVDKYEGDAIIAFFGAPLPEEDHAARCTRAALEMQNRLAAIRARLEEEGKPPLRMRIGINTGPMVVGNMGSRTRMDYTIMGDAVNLASRMESANKFYGTELMISDATLKGCGDLFEVRELDTIRVVGKTEPITVYEVLALKGDLDPGTEEKLSLYRQGLERYKQRDWNGGIDIFAKILEADESDGPSFVYLERCITFLENPPDDDWDGINILTSK